MDDEERKDCMESIELLKEEIKREKPRKMIFRGLLNNLAILPEINHIAEKMCNILKNGNVDERNRHQEEAVR